ncbi:hypothetical protein GCM10011583_50730 [Streptomyces camponoticapitis]|uniref:Uncharacterized protein n=1 Tax=Streptomyces camponoticapitis TaxID=1616125 RepID=A0ABQ2EIC3_9ACTN|nr:hypothetical protein GCM10011583_50730 [Streptomyces camponoticapitis]
MNSVQAPRWQRLSAVPKHRAEAVPPPPPTPPPPTAAAIPTPIYSALVQEWGAAGRTVPANGGAGQGVL